jgi:uncharacterized protein (DUF983 family)
MEMQKKPLGERFNPKRYGMTFCPQCDSRGKIFKTVKELEVCMACGGFGLIKTPREEPIHGRRNGDRFKN